VRTQRGNADDALLRRMYGPRWRDLLAAPPGRRRQHAAVTVAGAAALGLSVAAALTARRPVRAGAVAAGLLWAGGTARFAAARIMPGPRTAREVATMLATSVAIPPVAVAAWCRGWLRWRGARPLPTAPVTVPFIESATTRTTGPGTGPATARATGPATARAAVPATARASVPAGASTTVRAAGFATASSGDIDGGAGERSAGGGVTA
jgi:hypothetical protein